MIQRHQFLGAPSHRNHFTLSAPIIPADGNPLPALRRLLNVVLLRGKNLLQAHEITIENGANDGLASMFPAIVAIAWVLVSNVVGQDSDWFVDTESDTCRKQPHRKQIRPGCLQPLSTHARKSPVTDSRSTVRI
jgi:hypothetical protein